MPQLPPGGLPVPRIFRLDRGFSVAREVRAEITHLLAVQAPRLALGRREKPATPLAVAIRLQPHELDPRECARVIDDVRRGIDAVPDQPHQLPVVAEEQLRFIADEPSSELLGDGTWRVVAGVLRADF